MTKVYKVLTTGVFDLLHPGHIDLFYLIKERWPGCHLIVGVNGDRRAHEIKDIVLFNAEERSGIVGAIAFVDEVVIFEQDTPKELIGVICPDAFVKGGDWVAEELPEYETCRKLGIEVVCIDSTKDMHSSELKERLVECLSKKK